MLHRPAPQLHPTAGAIGYQNTPVSRADRGGGQPPPQLPDTTRLPQAGRARPTPVEQSPLTLTNPLHTGLVVGKSGQIENDAVIDRQMHRVEDPPTHPGGGLHGRRGAPDGPDSEQQRHPTTAAPRSCQAKIINYETRRAPHISGKTIKPGRQRLTKYGLHDQRQPARQLQVGRRTHPAIRPSQAGRSALGCGEPGPAHRSLHDSLASRASGLANLS
jgi:hypothetical protein